MKLSTIYTKIQHAEARLLKLKNIANHFENIDLLSENELVNHNSKIQVGEWECVYDKKSFEWSPETYQIFEYPEDFEGTLVEFYNSCIDENTAARFAEMLGIFDGLSDSMFMNQVITTPTGKKKNLSFSGLPLLNKDGEIVGVKGLVKDVTMEINGEKGLDNFFNRSDDLHCVAHMDRCFLKVTPAWSSLLGYTEEELLSRSYMEFIHPDDLDVTENVVVEVLDSGSAVLRFENRYIKKSGEIVYLSWYSKMDPTTDLIYCTARDVTESRIVRDQMLSDLSEKELLLREIHHRVKNNLQIITSLLSLQAGANKEEEHLNKLYEDSRNRIQSMAAIHEMFYQSEELDKIEVGRYLDKLIGDLSQTYTINNKSINFCLSSDSTFVNLDTAIPLGLLINEIVTNSIKHGEDNNGNVKISVVVESLKEDKLQIIIGDLGVNSTKNLLEQNAESLGILLINSLIEQIDGEIEQLEDQQGTNFKLTFVNSL